MHTKAAGWAAPAVPRSGTGKLVGFREGGVRRGARRVCRAERRFCVHSDGHVSLHARVQAHRMDTTTGEPRGKPWTSGDNDVPV